MKQTLILLTADFPYGTGETFLETEIVYLAKGFDEVKIITSNITDEQTRVLPSNCKVQRIELRVSSFQKAISILQIFDTRFWKELNVIRRIYKTPLSKSILATMLISLFRAKKVKKKVRSIVQNEKMESQLFFYSYWCDDVAIGLAMAQKELPSIKAFCRIHGWDVYFEVSSLNYLPYRHFISENLKVIFAISQKGKEYATNRWKIPNPEKVKIARLGVPEQTPVKQDSKEFILVSCSNVIPLKRVDLIVLALSQMKDYPLTWVHFGDGPQLDEISVMASDILPSNISVDFKGYLANHEVLSWYAKNNPNVFINVSSTEGIPVSIMEAMSFGIPVIATNVGGTSEIVNNENGLLLSPSPSVAQLLEAITFFRLLSIEQRTQFSQMSKETWENEFNAEKNYSEFAQRIQAL